MVTKYKCLECQAPAVHMRATQFSGNHPYCDSCAKEEEDFTQDDDSYHYWYPLEVSSNE